MLDIVFSFCFTPRYFHWGLEDLGVKSNYLHVPYIRAFLAFPLIRKIDLNCNSAPIYWTNFLYSILFVIFSFSQYLQLNLIPNFPLSYFVRRCMCYCFHYMTQYLMFSKVFINGLTDIISGIFMSKIYYITIYNYFRKFF